MSDSLIGNADRKWLFQGLGLTIVVIILAILFSLINPKFATITNLLNVLTQASYYIILAVGMTFVIAAAVIPVVPAARLNDWATVFASSPAATFTVVVPKEPLTV